ncbi:NUDIX hydrolase [Candidatus Woesearchaeota archaeon]|nr:NUDIX hydrolase [Candidatus Woesearchaeota archaeon]
MAEFRKDRFYVTADAVVFTILNKELKILLIKRKIPPFKGKFALPGGFVHINENLEHGAKRELEEETGVKNILLKKLHAFGNVGRDPRGRVVTIPFLALIAGEKVKLHASTDAELAKWQSFYRLPELAFDHKKILDNALSHLRFEIQNTNIAFQIMPAEFTLTELQNAYEIILDKKLDKRNFRKKLKELNILKKMPGTKMEGAHRPAQLYSFKKAK